MKTTAVGIDPGIGGGISSVGPNGILTGKFKDLRPRELFDLICSCVSTADVVYLEKVTPSPPQRGNKRVSGGKSMFTFGKNLGHIEMALDILGVPVELVTPRKWQTEFGLYGLSSHNQTQKKNAHKYKAEELFPQVKMTHAISDALLIAEYGRRVYNPVLQEAIRGQT